MLHRTLFGFRIIAIGGNPIAAQLARLPVRRYKIMAFIICSVLSAVAGILDFSFIQSTQPDAGLAQTFPVFAAVVIGGTSLSGGKGTIIGTLGGALLLAELQIGLALQTLGPYAQQLFVGFVTVGAVILDVTVDQAKGAKAAVTAPVMLVRIRNLRKTYGNTRALDRSRSRTAKRRNTLVLPARMAPARAL